jgi:hypothetical protein
MVEVSMLATKAKILGRGPVSLDEGEHMHAQAAFNTDAARTAIA